MGINHLLGPMDCPLRQCGTDQWMKLSNTAPLATSTAEGESLDCMYMP